MESGALLHRVFLFINCWLTIFLFRTPGTLLLSKTFQNTNFLTFEDVLSAFLKEAGVSRPPITACIACAGPVSNNTVTMTNRDGWVIKGVDLERMFGIREVSLINDFLAVGYGLMSLESEELVVLQVRDNDDMNTFWVV